METKDNIKIQKISTCLWFNNNTEEAVNFYTSVFKNSKIGKIAHYGKNAPMPEGTILTIQFQIEGQDFLALNAGPAFTFSEAISFVVNCDNQQEIDEFWSKLSKGGQIQECGWLKDQFGVSWQIVPTILPQLIAGPDSSKSERVMAALFKMKKLDIDTLQKAYDNK